MPWQRCASAKYRKISIKVFMGEAESPKATALLRAAAEGIYRLAAPDFMPLECGTVLWKYVGRRTLSETGARETLRDFLFDRFVWLPAGALFEKAFGFARVYDIGV